MSEKNIFNKEIRNRESSPIKTSVNVASMISFLYIFLLLGNITIGTMSNISSIMIPTSVLAAYVVAMIAIEIFYMVKVNGNKAISSNLAYFKLAVLIIKIIVPLLCTVQIAISIANHPQTTSYGFYGIGEFFRGMFLFIFWFLIINPVFYTVAVAYDVASLFAIRRYVNKRIHAIGKNDAKGEENADKK